MLSPKSLALGTTRSSIRDIFEFGRARAAVVGAENVYDYSLGNPSVPAPEAVLEAIRTVFDELTPAAIHGYTSAPGLDSARDAVANNLNKRFGTKYTKANLYLTCGAAASLTSTFRALTISDDTEFVAIAPFFPEYTVFAGNAGGKLAVVPADVPDFQVDFAALEAAVNANTQAVIVNSPNNPSGVVYTEDTIKRLAALLTKKAAEVGHPIYLVADEPYRELVYEGTVPFIPQYYADTIVCYSYSKSLSLPGERIGYVLVPDEATDAGNLISAIAGAARQMGFVCAPSLMQHVLARCADVEPDLAPYIRNRNLLYNALTEMGYHCAKPSGAFYLFVEAPGGDAAKFCEFAKQFDLLLVPGASFGCPGYLRASYCVDYDMIKRSLPAFEKAMKEFKA
ncbi:pyridoxal phosphate-dependent aminotransferase [Christensenellaceae bacterium OttesenSCG-928-L17]|nr:pyridoxal phosphate-dependent aminotransferase [Christensenellaceae bacterium OttesenSCG-928-L17]